MKVIAYKNLPARLPLFPTLTLGLLLDRLQAHPAIWGVTGALLALVWAGSIVKLCKQTQIEIWKA